METPITRPQYYTLLVAHGSRDPRWRKPFEALMHRLQAKEGYNTYGLCYMEMCEPTVEQHLATVNIQTYTSVRIVPLFMASGAHVANEIETLRHEIKAQYPHLNEVEVMQPIGEHPLMQQAMETIILEGLAD
jgi:sirohydrochlorin cobaltochelatase